MSVRLRCGTAKQFQARGWVGTRRGFTLLEVLLTVALIGLLSGALVTAAVYLTDDKPITPEDVFWKSVTESRRQALLTGRDVRLRFVKKDKAHALVATGAEGEQRFPFEKVDELTVDFLSVQKSGSAILIRGQLVETQTIPYVTFYGDGTCTPFRVQFRTGGAARSIAVDPWTCAPILVAGTTR